MQTDEDRHQEMTYRLRKFQELRKCVENPELGVSAVADLMDSLRWCNLTFGESKHKS